MKKLNYYQKELQPIQPGVNGFCPKIKITDGSNDYQTKWLDLTPDCIEAVTDKLQVLKNSMLGVQLSEIINQDGDEKTDGQCLDEIIAVLEKHNLYTPKK